MNSFDPGARGGHGSRDAAPPRARGNTLTLPSRPGPLTLPLHPGTLTAQRLKITLVLNATELNAIAAPEGKPRITLRICLPERTLTADIAAKSLRKAQTAIRDAGADNIALVLQGCLIAGDVIAEAGLTAQPKTPKPTPRGPATKIDHGSLRLSGRVP
jgi:hypothetical protein